MTTKEKLASVKHGNWVITKDPMEFGIAGMAGPYDATLTNEEIVKHGRHWRAYDADGDLYAEGKIYGGDGFEPLDDYLRDGLGATEIRYSERGRGWVTL